MEVAPASTEHQRRFMLKLPPGYHFAPTENELVVHYLRRKIAGLQPLLPIFFDVDNLNSYRPEQIVGTLADKYRKHGEDCWYFFTKRVRKYSTGNHPNRTTPGKGFWNATGPWRLIHVDKELAGRVRTLVFYTEPEKEEQVAPGLKEMDDQTALSKLAKTSWIMYEYENLTSQAEAEDKNIDKIDEWVLCTIQKRRRCNGKEKGRG
ncbi:hypothetical protein BRADI_1g61525v3 [Brachypodium distachyon]|uniref:NAC domain-containing protein n=1 Tax=Brachypodium distachyon TaxID=15368 RepID=A0A0Q3HGB1_BRADI|nr:hypothetical protein BRADI_1g61525v3 [Brachypodium distachyon]